MNAPIYLDYNATTPVAPEVAEAIQPFLFGKFGNPTYGSCGLELTVRFNARIHLRASERTRARPSGGMRC
jgi:hypothetical protein